ncbi:MAG TPA: hypothetical protein VMI53_11860 [Opitutaceae bacterium]|nr:hypothetical protein [Opitutaceae bacterium]
MKNSGRLILLASLFALGFCRGLAQVDPWEFEVYPYATTPRGMAEIETTNAVVSAGHSDGGEGTAQGTFASEHLWYNAYELTYGLTDRLEAAAYLNLARPDGGGLRRAGDKLRLRGRLFDEGTLPVNIGWYAELEWHKTPQFDDASQELELRPIVEKDFGPVAVMLNPKFEKVLAGAGHSQGFEFGYVAGVQYRWTRRLSPGLEFYGGTGLIDRPDPVSDQQHYLFPTVWGELPGGLEYNFGIGYGLTRGSDRVIFKFNLELERFVGAIFGPSSDRRWFF